MLKSKNVRTTIVGKRAQSVPKSLQLNYGSLMCTFAEMDHLRFLSLFCNSCDCLQNCISDLPGMVKIKTSSRDPRLQNKTPERVLYHRSSFV